MRFRCSGTTRAQLVPEDAAAVISGGTVTQTRTDLWCFVSHWDQRVHTERQDWTQNRRLALYQQRSEGSFTVLTWHRGLEFLLPSTSENLFPFTEYSSRIIVHNLFTFMFLHAQLQGLHVINMALVMVQWAVKGISVSMWMGPLSALGCN